MSDFFRWRILALFVLSASAIPLSAQCPLTISSAGTKVENCLRRNGRINITHDGMAPFVYTLNGVNVGPPPFNGLVAGNYTVRVRDAAGCEAETTLVVGATQPPSLSLLNKTDATCSAGGAAEASCIDPGATFFWSTAPSQPGLNLRNAAPGTYVLTAIDSVGCTATLSVSINPPPPLAVGANVRRVTCAGGDDGAVFLTVGGGSGNYNYSWSPAGGNGANAFNLRAGDYRVVVTDGLYCVSTLEVRVTERPRINMNLNQLPASGCKAPNGIAWVRPVNTLGWYTVRWDTFGGVAPIRPSRDTARNLYPGLYNVTLRDSAGCEDQFQLVITSGNAMTMQIEVMQEDDCGLGQGAVRALLNNATFPVNYRWFTIPPQLDSRSGFALNLVPGTYWVVARDTLECVARAEFTIRGASRLRPTQPAVIPSYCEKANGTASMGFAGGTPPYSYTWNTLPVQRRDTAFALPTGEYVVVVTDSKNCKDTATVFVPALKGFDLEVTSKDINCFGWDDGSAEAIVSGGLPPFSYTWSGLPSQNTALASNLAPGNYSVLVRDNAGCERRGFAAIGGKQPLRADFSAVPDTGQAVTLNKATFQFNNRSIGAATYRWIFGDGQESNAISPVHAYRDTGRFTVTLFAFSEDGRCVSSAEYGPYIVLPEAEIFQIPNAFSPNGDGYNDEFFVLGVGLLESYRLKVYNRWGRLVHESVSLDERWNGHYRDGGPVPEGVYVYHLQAITTGNASVEKTGTITLIR